MQNPEKCCPGAPSLFAIDYHDAFVQARKFRLSEHFNKNKHVGWKYDIILTRL